MKGYSIKCIKNTKLGFIEETLGRDSIWYVACNGASFKTLKEARLFFKDSNHVDHAIRALKLIKMGSKSIKIGHFQVDDIFDSLYNSESNPHTNDKIIKIGCHKILLSEAEKVLKPYMTNLELEN